MPENTRVTEAIFRLFILINCPIILLMLNVYPVVMAFSVQLMSNTYDFRMLSHSTVSSSTTRVIIIVVLKGEKLHLVKFNERSLF